MYLIKKLVGISPHVPKIHSNGPEYNALDAGSRQDVVVEIVDMRQHIFRGETRQVLTRFWSWSNLFRMKISCGAAIPKRNIRHVTVADRGHCDNGPPEAVGNGLEVGVRRTGLRKINCTWKENHAWKRKKKTILENIYDCEKLWRELIGYYS